MGYSNRFTGAITITPPLTWSDIQNGPKLRDVRLRIHEEKRTAVVDGAEAEVIVRTADAIVPLDMEYSGHRLEEDIQSVVDHYEGYGFAGFIEAQWDPGFGEPPSRFIVKDDRVMRIDAQYRWPGIWPAEQSQEFECEVCTKPITSYPCVLCEHEPDPSAAHRCDNCEGVDPVSCVNYPGAGQPQAATPLTPAELAELTASIEHLSGPNAWDEDRLEPALIPVTHYVPRLLAMVAQGRAQAEQDGDVRAVAAETAADRVVEFLDAWEADRGTGGSIRGGNADMPYLFVSDLRALVADAQQLRAQSTEYGIRADFTDTTSAEGAVADNLGDALQALAEFDAKHGGHVASRTLIQRPVGDWREIGDGRG